MSSSNKASDKDPDTTTAAAKAWELNIYELNRMPHEIIFDDTEIAVSPKILQNELMCPICLDILKMTMTTKECLHRFCHDCIITALRNGNKECPTCRKKLVSKRSLRPDPNFDGIISKIFPNREEYDALHEKVLEKLNKKHLTAIGGLNSSSSKQANRNANRNKTTNAQPPPSAPSTSSTSADVVANNHNENTNESTANAISNLKLSETSAAPNSNRGNKRALQQSLADQSDDSDMESRASTEQSSLHLQNDLDEIEIVLKPHPVKETTIDAKRFLKTTSNATMNHLSKYLHTRLCVEAEGGHTTNGNADQSNTFQLYISPTPNNFQLLNQNITLEHVIDKYWKQNRPVELFYVYKFSNSSGGAKQSSSSNVNASNKATTSISNGIDLNGNSNSSSATSSSASSSSSSSCSNN